VTMRRSDFDITNSVQVSSPSAVLGEVSALFRSVWPHLSLVPLEQAFAHFERLFAGDVPGYHGVETVYHDRQHTLDMTLALARLIVTHEQQARHEDRLGGTRAIVGIVIGLFHDVGYLRRAEDRDSQHGAEFTRIHVTRGALFLRDYLPRLGLRAWSHIAAQIVHYTGYEMAFETIWASVPDKRNIKLGHLLGTADMIAQMSDRCYLEKCRDRLYAEFVLGGVAMSVANNGVRTIKYASGLDLLRQTPAFVAQVRAKRLDGEFQSAYRYLETLYGGRNPYIEAIDRNLEYLRQILRSESWQLLRRNPPVFAAPADALAKTRVAVLGYLRSNWLPPPLPPEPVRRPFEGASGTK
jgi:hypothetical protein